MLPLIFWYFVSASVLSLGIVIGIALINTIGGLFGLLVGITIIASSFAPLVMTLDAHRHYH